MAMLFQSVGAMLWGVSTLAASPILGRLRQASSAVGEVCHVSGVPGASVGIIHDGKVIHTHNHGYSHQETESPTTSDTVYGIGSLTKSFIAAAIARLVDQNKLAWDTRVKDVLPEFHHHDPVVQEMLTVTDILSHRSGLAGLGAMNLAFQGDGDMLLPRESLFRLVGGFPTLFPFRQGWSYFVWGYALAGAIIEKVAEQPLEDFLRQQMLEPLSMNDTTFRPGRVDPARLAAPYAGLSGGKTYRLPKLQVFEDTFFEASGGLFSSVNDLLTWSSTMLEAIANDTSEASSVVRGVSNLVSNHAAIQNPSVTERSYGLGWARTQLPGVVGLIGDNAGLWDIDASPVLGAKDRPALMIYHQGSTVGYYSCVALFPATNSAVVVLTNSIGLSDTADWISRIYIQALFNFKDGQDYVALAKEANSRALAEFEQVSRDITTMRDACPALDPPDLGPFAGRYTHSLGIFVIDILLPERTERGGHLRLRFQGLEDQTYELRHLCHSTFEWSLTHDQSKERGRYNTASSKYYLFRFSLDAAGRAVSLAWANDPLLPDAEEILIKTGSARGGGSREGQDVLR